MNRPHRLSHATVSASGTTVEFWDYDLSWAGILVGLGLMLATIIGIFVLEASGVDGLFPGLLLIGVAAFWGASSGVGARKTVTLTIRSVTFRWKRGGVARREVVVPLEALESAEVRGSLLYSQIALRHTDGTVEKVRLGSLSDHRRVAEWLNDNLVEVARLDRAPSELIPIDLSRLSKLAVRERS